MNDKEISKKNKFEKIKILSENHNFHHHIHQQIRF